MSSGFSTAANWLQNISGANPSDQIDKKDEAHDPVLRDLRSMKDDEVKGRAHELPPPRHVNRDGARNASAHSQHQPKPKFVAHKAPTQAKKGKAKASSDRLGGSHMA